MQEGQYGKCLGDIVASRRPSIAECLLDNFFKIPPVATAAVASPAVLGQINLENGDAQASVL
jgi:hypothetical protein